MHQTRPGASNLSIMSLVARRPPRPSRRRARPRLHRVDSHSLSEFRESPDDRLSTSPRLLASYCYRLRTPAVSPTNAARPGIRFSGHTPPDLRRMRRMRVSQTRRVPSGTPLRSVPLLTEQTPDRMGLMQEYWTTSTYDHIHIGTKQKLIRQEIKELKSRAPCPLREPVVQCFSRALPPTPPGVGRCRADWVPPGPLGGSSPRWRRTTAQ